jgi:hypothetical protein
MKQFQGQRSTRTNEAMVKEWKGITFHEDKQGIQQDKEDQGLILITAFIMLCIVVIMNRKMLARPCHVMRVIYGKELCRRSTY